MAMNQDFVLDLLVSMFILTDEQAEQVRFTVGETGDGFLKVIEKLELATEEEVIGTLASEYGMETFDLTDYRIPAEIIELMESDIARRYKVVPVMSFDNTVTIAVSDPTDLETLDSLRYIMKRDIDAVVCREEQIMSAVKQYYGDAEEAVESFIQDLTESTIDITGVIDDKDQDEQEDDDSPIIRLVSLILVEAYRTEASDIHLEPMEKRFRVRYRIDGVLREVENPPKYLQNNIVSRLKIMSRLDISEKRVPQDGRIQFKMPGKTIDLRVSTVPTVHGESIVMRILDKSSIQLGIPELGFFADDQKMIVEILALPDGIFLVTGPTGSGKTTSLYAFLNTINTPNRKIITAEDPCEYELSGINQVQCDKSIGMTFAKALRAMLRQAPNVIMVGEIRDIETGGIAINAALTGHLVFSTLHTNDAPTAVTRLTDMGVKPFLVASALRAAMAQRLLRRVCKSCAQPVEASEDECEALELPPDFFEGAELKRGSGCDKCSLGYKGRMGIYEIFMVEDSIVKLIFRGVSSTIIKERAKELGMRNLRDDGLRKAAAGMSTLEEVIRITKADESEEDEGEDD